VRVAVADRVAVDVLAAVRVAVAVLAPTIVAVVVAVGVFTAAVLVAVAEAQSPTLTAELGQAPASLSVTSAPVVLL
jgi:hypothetical protein